MCAVFRRVACSSGVQRRSGGPRRPRSTVPAAPSALCSAVPGFGGRLRVDAAVFLRFFEMNGCGGVCSTLWRRWRRRRVAAFGPARRRAAAAAAARGHLRFPCLAPSFPVLCCDREWRTRPVQSAGRGDSAVGMGSHGNTAVTGVKTTPKHSTHPHTHRHNTHSCHCGFSAAGTVSLSLFLIWCIHICTHCTLCVCVADCSVDAGHPSL